MVSNENLLAIAKKTILSEANSIKKIADLLTNDFVQALEIIYKSKGRLVVTGIGKSAIIAQKIVATLNSTGTSAVFMHAADAIHGDIGMMSENDIVVCISKSGDTPEIKVLIPLIKNFGNKLIGIVSNGNSFLA